MTALASLRAGGGGGPFGFWHGCLGFPDGLRAIDRVLDLGLSSPAGLGGWPKQQATASSKTSNRRGAVERPKGLDSAPLALSIRIGQRQMDNGRWTVCVLNAAPQLPLGSLVPRRKCDDDADTEAMQEVLYFRKVLRCEETSWMARTRSSVQSVHTVLYTAWHFPLHSPCQGQSVHPVSTGPRHILCDGSPPCCLTSPDRSWQPEISESCKY
jgi:hypothetical protein